MTDPAPVSRLTLVSFALCPYVQRAAITLLEKDVAFTRTDIDLSDKPEWFRAISPLGKVPLLQVDGAVLFESTPIVEYLDEVYAPRLHPQDPLVRAQHRAWMEVGSSILGDLWVVETTADTAAFEEKLAVMRAKFARVEQALGEAPYFDGAAFRLVDAVFAPIFRYFDVFDAFAELGVFDGLLKVQAWREALRARPSVQAAVRPDYAALLTAFVTEKGGVLARRGGLRRAA